MTIDRVLAFIGLVRASKNSSRVPVLQKQPGIIGFSGEPRPWNKDSAALLKQFLHTGTGRNFLLQLGFYRPAYGPGSVVEQTALQARFVAGYEFAVNHILSLAEPPPEALRTPEQYPPLEDDSAWGNTTRR